MFKFQLVFVYTLKKHDTLHSYRRKSSLKDKLNCFPALLRLAKDTTADIAFDMDETGMYNCPKCSRRFVVNNHFFLIIFVI